MNFSLSKEQMQKLNEWLLIQYREIGEDQLANGSPMGQAYRTDEGVAVPYFGAIGGELTFEFSPTGLGDICVAVLCKGTKWEREINLTDYDSW